ncbi:hypothetical protein F7725_027729 [Dissostichus mawsoni]|uniref:Spermatogenesis-associated protein 1 C-terminal domain-containing protein n=1 Tax=Dissostichus mawsoni TaxID=36200 RepID=A0A7J5XE02_DISMA|nr:hypothetical protein F7725_027729 [Dissostichus mawsoni]
MQLSCESVRHPEDRRPASCKFLELHVLYVPGDQWNVKLNKVPAEAIESFISAGFIRSIDKFSFLKCVGRSLALAPQPELYLLPAVESDSSVCSQSLTPDTSSSSPDQQTYYQPPKTCSQPAGTKEPVKFPLIPQCSHQPPPTPSLGEEEEEEADEEQSYSSSEAEGDNEEGLSSNLEWAEQQCCTKKHHNQRAPQPVSQNDSDEVKENEETCRKKKQHQRQNRGARDSGVVQPLEDRDSGFSLSDGLGKSKDAHALKSIRNKQSSDVKESPAVLSRPGFSSPPQGLDLPIVTPKKPIHRVFHTNREELIEEIKMVREERKQLEWTRQELLRKGKDLLAQNRHRRNQARDSWKRKYFETKKATAPLEENLRNLRQELETFYNKLLHQLQARDNRGKPRRQGRSSIKNELIIQIMTESHEIDNLKRKVEDAKMKLITEIKLRKQAATELRALKAELAQKKSQSSHPGPMSSLGFGSTTRETPQAQRTSI